MGDFMNWSEYAYLIAAVIAAGVLLALLMRFAPSLSQPSRKRTAPELAFLGAIVLLAIFVIYGNFFLGKSFFAYTVGDPGSDAIEQYVPFYSNLIANVRDGSLSLWNNWSFEYELGVNSAGYQSWLYDPFNLVIVPLGLLFGDSRLAYVLVFAQALKILLSAYLFDHLLTRYCETPVARILGATLYSLCSYLLINGQHYWLGSIFPVFTLTALLFELYLEQSNVARFLGVVAITTVLMGWTVYVAFMVLLFEAIYLLLRIPVVLEHPTLKSYFLTVLRLCVPVVCGALLSGVLFVPYALFLLTETSRTSADTSLLERIVESITNFTNLDWIPAMLSRFMGSSLITTGLTPIGDMLSVDNGVGYSTNYSYEFILLGYSCGVFVLLSQFFAWAFTECRRDVKIIVGIATGLVALYCLNHFLPTLATAMVRLQYRSSFALAIPICSAMAIGFEKRLLPGRIAWGALAVSLVLSLVVLAWSLRQALMGRFLTLFFLAALLAAVAVLALAQRRPSWRPRLAIFLSSLLVATSAMDGFMGTNVRIHTDGAYFPLSGLSECGTNTLAALQYLRDEDPTFYRVEKTYLDWTPLNDSLIQHYPGVSAYNSSPDSEVDEFYHKLWSESISPWAVYSQGYWYDPDQPDIMQLLGVKYILSVDPVDFDWCELVDVVDGVHIYRNIFADTSIASVRQCVVPVSEADSLPDAAERRQLLASSVIVPDEIAESLSALFVNDVETTAKSTAEFVMESNGHLTGTIYCEMSSVVCLSIPHTNTWHITVDGKEVETFTANYGFVGFTLPAGSHEISASYELAGLVPGLVCTCAGLLATAVCAVVIRKTIRPSEPDAHLSQEAHPCP